jgi:hypothetical protein
MKLAPAAVGLIALITAAVMAAGCGGTASTTATVDTAATAAESPRTVVEFGHIQSLARKGSEFELRFDPAWFLSGVTAGTAAAEDGAIEPGQPVPNDNYVVDEGHRLLTYVVPGDARVTVLTTGGDPGQLGATPISVAELAQIVDGESQLELFEPLESGVWITTQIDTVRSIDQQYRP